LDWLLSYCWRQCPLRRNSPTHRNACRNPIGTKAIGLSSAEQKWTDIVKTQKGAMWSNLNIAADVKKRCAKNKANKTVCAVAARPCRPSTALKIQTGIPIIQ
jgi:hypothetical protein